MRVEADVAEVKRGSTSGVVRAVATPLVCSWERSRRVKVVTACRSSGPTP